MRQSFFTLFFLFFIQLGFSQTSKITGTLSNELTGDALVDFHVFIPNTTYQAFSDSTGKFILTGIPEGKWVIQVRGYGWETLENKVVVKAGVPLDLDLKLSPESSFASASDQLSKSKLSKLEDEVREAFVGKDIKDESVHFLNPDKLIFESQPDKTYKIASVGPLFFTNKETGYLVSIYFQPFILGSGEKIQQTVTYFELPREESLEAERRKARLAAFQRSPQNYLSMLMEGKAENFSSNPNPEVAFGPNGGDYLLSFSKPIQVDLGTDMKGVLDYSGENLEVKINGAPTSLTDLKLGGAFAYLNPIFGVPSNFNADRLTKLANLEKNVEVMQERLYVHTDRRHYWPAENIYFKAYLNYGNPLMVEELSKVLHVELLDSTGYVWMHQVFEIKDGHSEGHLALPDLSETGNFYLRSNTAWGLNYKQGEALIPIQILDHQSQPEASTIPKESFRVGVFSDKATYKGGEKVKLNIMAVDENGSPIQANLSVSVLDLNQAVYVPEPQSIEQSFLPKMPIGTIESFKYPVEKGFELEGQLLDDTGTPIQGSVKAFINGYEDIRTVKSEKEGEFSFPASNFQGDFEISLQASTVQSGKPIRTIELDLKSYPKQEVLENRKFPAVVRRGIQPDPNIQPVKPIQEGEILLEEAVVEEKKENSIGPMIYGRPDKVVMTENMNVVGTTIQFLYALSAQVAGMRINGSPPNVSVSFRGGEPLVLINGAPANGSSGTLLGGGGGRSVYDVFESVNVFNIERVEVLRRLVPQYGDLGRNGVISIILKTGEQQRANMNNYSLFKLTGFSKTVPFSDAEESRKSFPFLVPYRPTLYWNPLLISDGSRLSIPIEFELNELPGPILIEIRGITNLGQPIYGTFVLNQPN
ncbi:TonB-dependent receptor-like protein [Algoriphagus boseongensis]|uniref:TonB-dependent receptor-like protein n=1 Tax=Algoriphagus boseongensis TaxID=1442587 RepID=A0A4R6T6Z4_9BACT|nr:carboxypeptidase regulatory-like domain-containing protein [Algoriphagus boseongensis]TDQ17452.1 TonB-dependent receptor-like protein [Algoriphagus boseongensis]